MCTRPPMLLASDPGLACGAPAVGQGQAVAQGWRGRGRRGLAVEAIGLGHEAAVWVRVRAGRCGGKGKGDGGLGFLSVWRGFPE